MKKSFTLVETIIAITIFSIGVVGIFSSFPRVIEYFSQSRDRFIASQLAQEGLEVVRNIRDSNYIQKNNWLTNLSNGDYILQYNSTSLLPYQDIPLKISSDNLYNYTDGNNTKFKRKITIENINATTTRITVTVSWLGKGSPFVVREILYNWK